VQIYRPTFIVRENYSNTNYNNQNIVNILQMRGEERRENGLVAGENM